MSRLVAPREEPAMMYNVADCDRLIQCRRSLRHRECLVVNDSAVFVATLEAGALARDDLQLPAPRLAARSHCAQSLGPPKV